MITKDESIKIRKISMLAAFLVVCIHTPWSADASLLTKAIRWAFAELGFAVPFFFIVSGFFLGLRVSENNWWQAALTKRIKTLFVPYIFWTGLFGVLMLGLNGGHICPRFLINVFGLNPKTAPMLGPMWYVRNLILMVILSPLIVEGVRKWPKMIGGVVILVDMITFPLYKIIGGEFLGALTLGWFSTHAMAFFTLGLIFAQQGVLPRIGRGCGVVFSAIGVLLLGVRFIGVEVYAVQWVQLLQPLQVLFLLAAVWSLVLGSDGFLNRMAHLSFPIYVIHWFMIVGYQELLNYGILSGSVDSRFSALGYLSVSVAVFVASGLVALLGKIVAPRFTSIVFGGRA